MPATAFARCVRNSGHDEAEIVTHDGVSHSKKKVVASVCMSVNTHVSSADFLKPILEYGWVCDAFGMEFLAFTVVLPSFS